MGAIDLDNFPTSFSILVDYGLKQALEYVAMPNVYKPGLVQIRPQYSIGGDDQAENVTWWDGGFTSPLSLTQLTNIIAAFDTAWAAMWKVNAFDSSHYLGSIITDWSTNAGLQESSVGTLTPVAGTGGTSPAGAQVCILISKSDGTRYKGGHSRIYLPGVAAPILPDPSHISSGTQGTLVTNYLAVDTAMNGLSSGNGGPFLDSIYRFRNDTVKAQVKTTASFKVNLELATQRRRLRKAAHT